MRNKEGGAQDEKRGKGHREKITGHNGERPEKEKGRKCGVERAGLRIKIGGGGAFFCPPKIRKTGVKFLNET